MHPRSLVACLVVLVAMVVGAATTASASGGYQIAFSNNCNNPAFCTPPPGGPGLGGDWGSVRLNAGGTGSAEFTTASHQTAGIPTGATHLLLALSWNVSQTAGAQSVAPDPNGNYLVISVVNFPDVGMLVTPATPGHYKFQGAQVGMPGVNFMVQINPM
jgi:hypothetical protein